jgi:hypothetical protein
MTTIRPTHQCFDDALDFFEAFRLDNAVVRAEVLRAMRVAHGICVTPDGHKYAHAWVEERVRNDPDRSTWPERVVWQGMLCEAGRGYYAVALDWFYEAYAVRERTIYTLQDCARLNVRTGHYGPWVARYRALTNTTAERRIIATQSDATVLGFLEATSSNPPEHRNNNTWDDRH